MPDHRVQVEDLIGASEAARILGLSGRGAVQYRVLAGNLEPVGRLGRAYVFSRREIQAVARREAAARFAREEL